MGNGCRSIAFINLSRYKFIGNFIALFMSIFIGVVKLVKLGGHPATLTHRFSVHIDLLLMG